MCPPTGDRRIADIGSNSSDEELIWSLSKMIRGAPIPGNVVTDVNPFHCLPYNLPDGIWFFICSDLEEDREFGFWKVKGKATKVISNFAITGWKTTLEFYEGQDPYGHITEWSMLLYTVSQEGQYELKTKGASSLCRVFYGITPAGEEKKRPVSLVDTSQIALHSSHSIDPQSNRISGQRSMNDNDSLGRENGEVVRLGVTDTALNDLGEVPANTEVDCLSRGDYLELLDLDDAVSRSSSENSSCLTMSSDEYFDDLALLQDLEREDGKTDAVCKYNISTSHVPNECITLPARTGSVVMSQQNSLQTTEVPRKNGAEVTEAGEKVASVKGGPSRISIPTVSAENDSPALRGQKKAAVKRMKMIKKYLCFM